MEISYLILPLMVIDGELLPDQIDITQVILEIPDVKGKPRRVNILSALDESTVMLLEDEVLDSLSK